MPPKVSRVSTKGTATVLRGGGSTKSSGSSKTSSSSSAVKKTATTTTTQRPVQKTISPPSPKPNVDKVDFGKQKPKLDAVTYKPPVPKQVPSTVAYKNIEAATGRAPEPPKTPSNLIRDKERTERDVKTEREQKNKTIQEQRRELGTDRAPGQLGPYGIKNYKPEPYKEDALDAAMDVGAIVISILGGPPGQVAVGVYEAGKIVRNHIMQKEADKYNEQHKTDGS